MAMVCIAHFHQIVGKRLFQRASNLLLWTGMISRLMVQFFLSAVHSFLSCWYLLTIIINSQSEWNALFFLLTAVVNFLGMFLHFNSSCLLFCRIGFTCVLAILDPALQIKIHIKARSFYFHVIPVLRLHLWSLVLIITLPVIDPMWLVPILRHLKWEIVLWFESQVFSNFFFKQSSNLDWK